MCLQVSWQLASYKIRFSNAQKTVIIFSLICDWISKTCPDGTRNEYILALELHCTLQHYLNTLNIMALDRQFCFHKWTFVNLVKPWRCTTEPVELMNSINKDVCSAKLLPITLLKTQHCCLCPKIRYYPPPAAYPLSLSTNPPFLHATHDITVAVKKLFKLQQWWLASKLVIK